MIDALEKVASPMCDTAPPEVAEAGPDEPTAEVTAPIDTSSPPPTGTSPQKPRRILYAAGGLALVAVAAIIALVGGGDEPDHSGPASDTIAISSVTDAPDTAGASPGPPPTGTIAVSVSPRGDIYIDDSLVAGNDDGVQFEADTGRHIVRVENAGSEQKKFVDTLYLAEGFVSQREYRFTFPPVEEDEPEPEPSLGQVRVWTWPDEATVYIDGRKQDYLTNFTFEVPAGRHTIRAERTVDGGIRSADTTLLVKADSIHVVRWDFRK
jgi:hypothetical protein